MKQLSEHIWYMPCEESVDRPNLYLICGSEDAIMVDGGNSRAHALSFLDDLDKRGLPRPSKLFITHWHWDHVFGAEAIPARMIVHPLTEKKLVEMNTWTWDDDAMNLRLLAGTEIEFCHTMIQKELIGERNIVIRTPDETLDCEREFALGGVTVSVFPMPSDHGNDCLAILIKEDQILLTGDALGENYYNGLPKPTYTKEKLGSLIDQLQAIPAKYFGFSHEEALDQKDSVLSELRSELEKLNES